MPDSSVRVSAPSAIPTPRPPMVVVRNEPDEFAHVMKVEAGALAAVFVGRRSQGRVVASRVWEGPQDESRQVVVDQVIDLIRLAQALPEPLTLVGPTKVMLRLRQMGFSDPQVILGVRNGRQYLDENMALADQWRQAQTQRDNRPPKRLLVATDASVGLGRASAGLACVDETGRQCTWQLRSRDVLYCELRAIQLAVEHFSGPLQILTDSRSAVSLITNPEHRSRPRVQALTERIRQHMAGRDVSIEWVRGHDGHPLNEAADRLAMAARRARELSMPAHVARQINQRIVQDLVEGAA